ncbi:MAG: ATP-grasp protein [Herminiimonas sp.]|nr:ATP-grasp protein [Herminiimonas sp.]
MNILFVVSHLRDWPFDIPGVKVVPARLYLTDPAYIDCTATKVFNLCQSYRYQSRGYYVSLLAEARGHQPLPDIKAIEDLQSESVIPMLAESLDELIQSALSEVDSDAFELTGYFGRTADRYHEHLSEQLFNLLRVPLLQVRFERDNGRWHLHSAHALMLADIPPGRLRMAAQAAADCLKGHALRVREPAAQKPTLAILRTPDCQSLPSNSAAIQKFQEAAESLGIRSEVITQADAGRVTQFDALFIRDTTNVNHYTYQMARQAAVAGMVVIDDPDSILKCNNKVYMTELLSKNHIPIPKTMMVHRDNVHQVIPALGLPCILKQPDGAFSIGVEKIESEEELLAKVDALFETSELILAQEYLPTEFDWRIGVLDRRPLFVCKYFMAPGHWQIIKHEENRQSSEGMAEALALSQAPDEVIDIAMRAANLIGDGFYGVDLKQRGHQCYIIEINDNPNVDAGNEDGVLKDALYREVMSVFRKRIEARKGSIA